MTWREQTVVRILLLVAKIVDEGPWRDDIKNLANHISTARFQEPLDAPVEYDITGREQS